MQSLASDSEVRVDGDARLPDESGDCLLVFPSEKTGVDGSGSDLLSRRTGPADEAPSRLTVARGGPTPQKMADTRQSIASGGHSAALTKLYDLCLGIDERLARAERALQGTGDPAIDPIWLDRFTRLDERMSRVELALQTLQAAVPGIDETIHELRASMVSGFDRTEEALRRTEGPGAARILQQFAARIDTRLADTTETLGRIEQLVGGGSMGGAVAALSARSRQTEETLRRIERLIEAGSTDRVDEGSLRRSPDAGAVRHESASVWMAASTATVWNAVMSRVDVSGLGRRLAPALVLLCVLAVVTVRFRDPRTGLQDGGVGDRREVTPSSELILATAPAVIVPAVEAAPLLTTTTQPSEPKSPAVEVARSRRAVLPAPPRKTAPEPVTVKQNAAPAQFVGTLEVASNPDGASVFVNGQSVGVTPLRLAEQQAGSLALQIRREGYVRWSASIQVPANRVTKVTATLRPGP